MKYIFIILSGLFFFTQVLSDDVTIEMLNKLGKERMIFSEKIVNVNAGDSVFWKATDKGHNVEFIKNGTPEGVEKFKSKLSEKLGEMEVRNVLAELLDNFDKNMIKYLIDDKEYKNYLGVSIEKIIPDYKKVHKKYCDGKFWYYNALNTVDGMPIIKYQA